VNEEVYVGIDADTVIAADAIAKLIPTSRIPSSAPWPATPRWATA